MILSERKGEGMEKTSVRLAGITIHNFKNVGDGSLSFENKRKNYKASLLGLYGQNGSGKTALIDAIKLLKYALCGSKIPVGFADYINVDAESATLIYEFQVGRDDEKTMVVYQFSIKAVQDITETNTQSGDKVSENKKVCIYEEVLKCQTLSDKQTRYGRLIDTNTSEVFLPRPKKALLIGKDKAVNTDLLVIKKLAEESSRSFIFSAELLTVIRKNVDIVSKKTDSEKTSKENELLYYFHLIEAIVDFGNHELFIINTQTSGMISLKAQPFIFKYEEGKTKTSGTIMIPLEHTAAIPKQARNVVGTVIDRMNKVLVKIIPGLTISVKDLGTEILKNGEEACRIQLMSNKNSKEIPLSYESEGIKKIVSILQLLIVVYNDPSITVAVDELDAGVFEYLLGELLRIISERGKGQLIFTSHNLRPLETLDRGFVAFTTTNPEKRYVRMTNVKENNNLRDFYYRDIMLGEQDDKLYDHTNNSEIAFAFREAGEVNDP